VSRLRILGACALLVTAFVAWSCGGDTGPAGPQGIQGPPGPSTILAFGVFDNAGTLVSVGPASVTASAINSTTGRFQVTVTFPDSVDATVEPTLLVSVQAISSPFARAMGDMDCYFGTSTGSGCAINEVDFEVFIHSISDGTAINEGFSFILLQD